MKAILLKAYGGPDQLQVEEATDPSAGLGEVLVKIAAASLNPADSKIRQGFLAQFIPLELPAVLGFDGAGTIEAVGADVADFNVGDRVIVFLPPNGRGTYAEHTASPASHVAKLPDGVSFDAGATLPLVGLTGRQCVGALGVSPGDRVLVSGALGGVGRAAVQYLKEIGAQPIAGVRANRLEEGRNLAGEAIDIEQVPAARDFSFAVSTAEPVAGNLLAYVQDGGKVATVVGVPDKANSGERVTVIAIFAGADAKMLEAVAHAAGRGEFAVPIALTFPADQAAEAHQALDAGLPGKIVITF
jgi:NADPH:quinone reductase-like Zn-dependent oxidoreductase